MSKWTQKEDELLTNYVNSCIQQNLPQERAFEAASGKIHRTVEACRSRWAKTLRKSVSVTHIAEESKKNNFDQEQFNTWIIERIRNLEEVNRKLIAKIKKMKNQCNY